MQAIQFHRNLFLTLLFTWMGYWGFAQTQINHFPTIEKYSVLFGDNANNIRAHLWDRESGVYIASGYKDYFGFGDNVNTDTIINPSGPNGFFIPVIAKYDTSLNILWSYHLSATNPNSYGYIQDLDLDLSGNLVATVIFSDTLLLNDTTFLFSQNQPTSDQGVLVLTLSKEGDYLNHLLIDPPFPSHCIDLEIDSAGDIYIFFDHLNLPFVSAGDTIPVSAAGSGSYHGIIKFNPFGEILDYQIIKPLFGTGPLGCKSFKLGPGNELYLLVEFRSRNNQNEAYYLFGSDSMFYQGGAYLIQFSELDQINWIKNVGETYSSLAKVMVDEAGYCLVSTPRSPGSLQTGVSRYTSSGKRLWTLTPSGGNAHVLDWYPLDRYLLFTGYYQDSLVIDSASWTIPGGNWGASTIFIGLVDLRTGNPEWVMSDGVGNQIKIGRLVIPTSKSSFILGGDLNTNFTSFDTLEIITQSAPEVLLMKFQGDFLPNDTFVSPLPTKLIVYPNPSSDQGYLYFPGNDGEKYRLSILNTLGNPVFEEKSVSKNEAFRLPDQLSNGLYFIIVRDGLLSPEPIILNWIKH